MTKDIQNSLNMLEKKKIIMSQNVVDNSGRVKEKLAEILHAMAVTQRSGLDRKTVPFIDAEYIQSKISHVEKTIGGVFNEYVRSMITKTINVGEAMCLDILYYGVDTSYGCFWVCIIILKKEAYYTHIFKKCCE